MGGYAIQSHFLEGVHPINGQERVALTNHGILWLLLMAPEVFPNLSEDEILDKSKASTLVKTLTCLQAMWFCLQCIVRLTMNASVSLLELNVFGHCICIFVIYAIWWNKPMDISEPTLLQVQDQAKFQGLIALLCSHTSRTVPRLPPQLSGHVFSGYEYRQRKNVSSFTGASKVEYSDKSNTQFNTRGCPVRDTRYVHERDCGPDIAEDEVQIYECAGRRIERFMQLLHLDESDSEM
jgi:hypothetical protein